MKARNGEWEYPRTVILSEERRSRMNKRLKEFVDSISTTMIAEGQKSMTNLDFAQAIAAFAEERVLEELVVSLLQEKDNHHPTREVNLRAGLQLAVSMINQRLAALRAGKEKDGKD